MLKLAYESPLTGLHIAEAFAEADLPAGVLNVLTGRGSVVGAALVRDPRVRAISFTGSVATGSSVRDEATKLGKRVQLELGGHNPLIVMADADLDRAVEASYAGAFWSAGQKCTATRRIYVQDEVYDTFKEKLARTHRPRQGRRSGRPRRRGRARSSTRRSSTRSSRRSSGASARAARCSPAASAPTSEGYVIAPTVFEGVGDNAFLSCEEVFGPVTSLYRFATLDEALAARERRRRSACRRRSSPRGSPTPRASRTRPRPGLLHVNSQTAGADVHVPFGGIKSSGFGPHEQGRAAIEFYTETVTIYVDP